MEQRSEQREHVGQRDDKQHNNNSAEDVGGCDKDKAPSDQTPPAAAAVCGKRRRDEVEAPSEHRADDKANPESHATPSNTPHVVSHHSGDQPLALVQDDAEFQARAACFASMATALAMEAFPCKEVVLTEFRRCHKHFDSVLHSQLTGDGALERTIAKYARAIEICDQIEHGAEVARLAGNRTDYQRKMKLLPKYRALVSSLADHRRALSAKRARVL